MRDGPHRRNAARVSPKRPRAQRTRPCARQPCRNARTTLRRWSKFTTPTCFRGADARAAQTSTGPIRAGEHTAITGANGFGKRARLLRSVAGTLAPVLRRRSLAQTEKPGPFDVWQIKEQIAHVSEEWQVAFDVKPHGRKRFCSRASHTASASSTNPTLRKRHTRGPKLIDQLDIAKLRARPFSAALVRRAPAKCSWRAVLVRPPDLFILDEIWNGLDAAFRTLLEAHVKRLADGADDDAADRAP